jgi:multiple sugar transport system substrate-binding protein
MRRLEALAGVTMFACLALALLALAALLGLSGCGNASNEHGVTLRFWALGREGEVVAELVRDFERENPGVHVQVQQIPWGAAHEKLLTAYVGGATPDLGQIGNTWVSEFATLRAIEPLDAHVGASAGIDSSRFFSGIWDTNVIDGHTYGIPWYVDTRVLFYRTDVLARAGYRTMPTTWSEWRGAMEAVKRAAGKDRYAIFLPTNEFMQAMILGMQNGSPMLADHDTRGAFEDSTFKNAFAFYLDMFRSGLAPPMGNNDIANVYQEFERGTFAMYITGPWNLGEFRRRLPESLQSSWSTAPLPGPTGSASGISIAGGSSLVLFRGSKHKTEAWRLIEFLARPEQQVRFYRLTGDLPARREAWNDSSLTQDATIHAFWEQLQRVRSQPKIPEWELISIRLMEKSELAIRGKASGDSVLASLDREVNGILEKRRWIMERRRAQAGAP